MMYPSWNIDTSTNLYDPSRALEDIYNSSPSLFPSSTSLHHHYLHGDGDNNIETTFFQDLLENHHEMMMIPQQQPIPVEIYSSYIDNNYNNGNIDKSKRVGIEKSSPRKKVSKNDRHTKIETAQGPRDRRMRLSLDIARRFFHLQDMLGFDKASKTVEWLLTKSISAIAELSKSSSQQQVCANSSLSSTSEIVMDELSSTNNGKLEKGMPNNKDSELKKPKKVVRATRPPSKKSREKARERARERTYEKMQKRRELTGTTDVVGHHGSSFLGSGAWNPSSTFLNLQQNDGIIHGLTTTELEHLSGNLGRASIW